MREANSVIPTKSAKQVVCEETFPQAFGITQVEQLSLANIYSSF